VKFEQDKYIKYDLREPSKNVIHANANTQNVNHMENDWTDIHYYPTQERPQYETPTPNLENVISSQIQTPQIILNRIRQYNELIKQQKSKHKQANKSANIRLGGIY
jgi:hypothetical protein